MIIIGIAGTNGSGKDTIAHLLVEKYGFVWADVSTVVGAELDKRGLSHERLNKAMVMAEWRRQYGMAVIVEKGLEMFKAGSYQGLVVGSLRHPGEADRVHELGGTVIWVDADPKIRYQRITSNDRGRVEDRKTFAEFMAEEEREMYPVGDAATLHGAAVKERADIFLENNGNDIEAFTSEVEKQLTTILSQ
jgi:dephospho-CoA kinase